MCASTTRDMLLLLLHSHTQDVQALVLYRSHARCATDDAYLFTPPGVYVCVAVDVLKFSVRIRCAAVNGLPDASHFECYANTKF